MRNQIQALHSLLIRKGKTVAVAESCTGGLVSEMLTRTPGSSSYFLLGVVAYSNAAKENILKVPRRIISQKGAVSQEVAVLLAAKVRKISQSHFGIGITGIAGPQGVRPGKPVGTVFIALEGGNRQICRKFVFTGKRDTIRKKAASKALALLKTII
jgi:nicotinamide-nucleotide amidase